MCLEPSGLVRQCLLPDGNLDISPDGRSNLSPTFFHDLNRYIRGTTPVSLEFSKTSPPTGMATAGRYILPFCHEWDIAECLPLECISHSFPSIDHILSRVYLLGALLTLRS